jgi:hypothetical protein
VASTASITIQLLTAAKDGYGDVASNFTVLHFADPNTDPPLGYFDGPLGGYMVSNKGDVTTMINMFDDLRHTALPESDSAEMLAAILNQQRRKGGNHA